MVEGLVDLVQVALQRAQVEGEAQVAQLLVEVVLQEAYWWPEWCSDGLSGVKGRCAQLTVVALETQECSLTLLD